MKNQQNQIELALIHGTFATSFLLIVGGIALAVLERNSGTSFRVAGCEFSSSSAGVAMAALGFLVDVALFRLVRSLKRQQGSNRG
jgi:hypothetical protein